MTSATDYYTFGWEMPGRKYNSDKYRYGFNGKEKDQNGEFGSITNYDYGFRIYNPGIGKFLSVDPLTKGYPMLTPYQFASNRPIDGIDLDGLEYEEAKFDRMSGISATPKSKKESSTSINVFVLPDDIMIGSGGAAVGVDRDNGGRGDGMDDALSTFTEAAKKLKNVEVIYTSDVSDLVYQLEGITKSGRRIKNLIIGSHGRRSDPSFWIGNDEISASKGNVNTVKQLKPFLSENSQCVIVACNTGGGRNPSRAATFVQRIANRLEAPVMASMSWGAASSGLFNVNETYFDALSSLFSDPITASYVYKNDQVLDEDINSNRTIILNMGMWIRATPIIDPNTGRMLGGLQIDTTGAVIFDQNGNFSTDKLRFKENREYLERQEQQATNNNGGG